MSLYAPYDKQLHDVISALETELSTASNIKSDATRDHVTESLARVIWFLKTLPSMPQNGIVAFCGVMGAHKEESLELYHLEPPKRLRQYLYRCDDHFHLDMLRGLLDDGDLVGFLALDAKDAGWGLLSGDHLEVLDHTGSGVPGKHRQGGQSAKRFEKLREMHLNDYYSRVARTTRRLFLDERGIRSLIVSGPGHTKNQFLDGKHLEYRLRGESQGGA